MNLWGPDRDDQADLDMGRVELNREIADLKRAIEVYKK
jgi:hypothetical protein